MSQVVRGKAVAVEGVVLVAICLLLEGGEAEKSGRRIILVLSRRSCSAAVHRIVCSRSDGISASGPWNRQVFPRRSRERKIFPPGLRGPVSGWGGHVRNNRFRG